MTDENKPVPIRFPIWKDYTFKEVFSVERLFRRLIESLFQKEFHEITSLTAQSELRPAALARWEDLDVEAYVADQPFQKKEDQILIDAEMQNKQLNTILSRARITGSGLDVRHTRKGTSTYNLIHAQRRIIISNSRV